MVHRGKTKPALLVMEEESDLIFKRADDGIGWSWRNCVIALRNEVMLSGLIWQAAILAIYTEYPVLSIADKEV